MDENEVAKLAYQQQEAASPTPPSNVNAMSRPPARRMLLDRIERLQREAKQLEALYKALPLELPEEADRALLELIYDRRY